MTTRLAFLLIAALAGCGAPGAPEPKGPEPAPRNGIEVSGSVEIGIIGGNL